MKFLRAKQSSTVDKGMLKSEATTAVPSENVSKDDLAVGEGEKNDMQATVDAQTHPRTSLDPPMKTEELTAIEEAKALERPDETEEEELEYPKGLKLFVISIALCLSVFLVALVSMVGSWLQHCRLTMLAGQYNNRHSNPSHH